jgi:hypothetical protein
MNGSQMRLLSAFNLALLFRGVAGTAAIAGVVRG